MIELEPDHDVYANDPTVVLVVVSLYVCPTPGCGNFYGSKSMPDLAAAKVEPPVDNKAAWLESHPGDPVKFMRAECPDCRQRGHRVERVLYTQTIVVPVPGAIEAKIEEAQSV